MGSAIWKSVEDLVTELGVPASPGDLDAVEKALKQQIATVHPDVTNGAFASNGQEERYHRLHDAIEFIKSQRSGTLALRTADLPALIEAAALALHRVASEPMQTRSQIMETVRQALRRSYRQPKVTSAILFTVATAVFPFIDTINKHPFLQAFGIRLDVAWLLATVWAISGIGFIVMWLREQSTAREVQDLLSEQSVQQAFRFMCWHAGQNPDRRFSRTNVFDNVLPSTSPANPFLLRRLRQKVKLSQWVRWFRELALPSVKIDHQTAEQITSFYLSRWLERGAITRSTWADSDEWFEVNASVLERHTS